MCELYTEESNQFCHTLNASEYLVTVLHNQKIIYPLLMDQKVLRLAGVSNVLDLILLIKRRLCVIVA